MWLWTKECVKLKKIVFLKLTSHFLRQIITEGKQPTSVFWQLGGTSNLLSSIFCKTKVMPMQRKNMFSFGLRSKSDLLR